MASGDRPQELTSAALFTPREGRRFRRRLVGAILAPVLLVLGLMAWVRLPPSTGVGRAPSQPVPFDHRIHAGALAIDCRFCHAEADHAATAGMPPSSACVACHQPALYASATFAPVRQSIDSSMPIPWARVYQVPDFVYFNHGVHVANGVGCETCHGRVDRMSRVRQAKPLTMAWCVSCHRSPEAHLRPDSLVTAMGWAGPPAHRDVRHLVHCTACHR